MSNVVRTVDTLERRVGALWSTKAGLALVGGVEVVCAADGAGERGGTLRLVMSKNVAFGAIGVGAKDVVFRQGADVVKEGEGADVQDVDILFS